MVGRGQQLNSIKNKLKNKRIKTEELYVTKMITLKTLLIEYWISIKEKNQS